MLDSLPCAPLAWNGRSNARSILHTADAAHEWLALGQDHATSGRLPLEPPLRASAVRTASADLSVLFCIGCFGVNRKPYTSHSHAKLLRTDRTCHLTFLWFDSFIHSFTAVTLAAWMTSDTLCNNALKLYYMLYCGDMHTRHRA